MKTMRYEYGSSIDDVEPTVKAYIKDDVLLYISKENSQNCLMECASTSNSFGSSKCSKLAQRVRFPFTNV